MNSSASVIPARSVAGADAGSGSAASTATDWPGLMPHVTVGAIDSASILTTSSHDAPGSDASVRHHARAFSNASAGGANGRPRRYSNVVSSGFT